VTSHVGRLYFLAVALVVFFLAWAVVAARPWATRTPAAGMQALALREAQLRREAALVNQIVALKKQRTSRLAGASAPPAVRVVTLPPLTITRTS
jgi:hypothetical protein